MSAKKKDDHSSFISKFKNQIESIGKDGITGLMKSAHLSITQADPCFNGPLGKWNELYQGSPHPKSNSHYKASASSEKSQSIQQAKRNLKEMPPFPKLAPKTTVAKDKEDSQSKAKSRNEVKRIKQQSSYSKSNSNSHKQSQNIRVFSQRNVKVKALLPDISIQQKKSVSPFKRQLVIPMTPFNRKNKKPNNNLLRLSMPSQMIKNDLDYLNEIKRQNTVLINNNPAIHYYDTNFNVNLNTFNKDSMAPQLFNQNIFTNKKALAQGSPLIIKSIQPLTSSLITVNKPRRKHQLTKSNSLGVIKEEDEPLQRDEVKGQRLISYKPVIKNESDPAQQVDDCTQSNSNDNGLSDIEKIMLMRKGYKSLFVHL